MRAPHNQSLRIILCYFVFFFFTLTDLLNAGKFVGKTKKGFLKMLVMQH